ncbi:hypothetical protein CARUB_v10025728mg [Capsella rubella]|uniref:Uncharacterized protein n=1 Tax=Capsella rubella TaxID=81985 RepID=R0HZD6_9BRAS|nr:hypothetical protein CARUB_v10025728mg [Capsella rubella]
MGFIGGRRIQLNKEELLFLSSSFLEKFLKVNSNSNSITMSEFHIPLFNYAKKRYKRKVCNILILKSDSKFCLSWLDSM